MAEQLPQDQGRIVVIQPTDPAMGSNPTYTQPIRVRWHLKSYQAVLATEIAVADRIPELTITQDGVEVLRITASQLLAASSTFIYGWMEGERALAVSGQTSRVTALPRSYHLNNQAVIAIETKGIQIGDQWSGVVIVAEEWIEPLA